MKEFKMRLHSQLLFYKITFLNESFALSTLYLQPVPVHKLIE